MTDAWVTNASPIILFARIDRLDLINRLAPAVIVPRAVADEILAGQEKDGRATMALSWVESRLTPNVALPATVEHWDLGSGESQVIAHDLLERALSSVGE